MLDLDLKKTGMLPLERDESSFNEWTRNHVWFRSHYQRLARTYDRENIAVCQARVVDHDKNLTRLLNRVKKKYPKDGVVVEYVSSMKQEQIYSEHGSRNRLELTQLYGMGSQHKKKILEGIRELEREHDKEPEN